MKGIELFFSIAGSVSSILSLCFTLVQIAKSRGGSELSRKGLSVGTEKNDSTVYIPKKWPIVTIVSMVIVFGVASVFAFISTKPESKLAFLAFIICFSISLIAFFVYAYFAAKSFDGSYVLPPVKFWQVVFNKIPSFIKGANQLEFKFLVLKMEDSEAVNDVADRIVKDYENRPGFDVVVNTYDSNKNDYTDEYCGVIFIVGEQCADRLESVLKVMDEYSLHLQLPIAYIRVGENHYKFEKYYRISSTYIDRNCASHLIMRSYRRSERWIRLSRYSHVAFILLSVLLLCLSLALVGLLKSGVNYRQGISKLNHIISQKDSVIRENEIRYRGFGINRDLIHLDNTYNVSLPDYVDIESLKTNELFKVFNDRFVMYYFSEARPNDVTLWLRNSTSTNDELVCIYNHNNKVCENKGFNTMIGGITNLADPTFVLWPGRNNALEKWRDSTAVMAWANVDKHPQYYLTYAIADTQDDSKISALYIQKTENDSLVRLDWYVNDSQSHNDNSIGLMGYSPDHRLSIEIDFSEDIINNGDPTFLAYIQNLEFRNDIRRYAACVTSLIRAMSETQ